MVLTLYHCPPSYPSRAALMVARAVGVDIRVKTVNLFEKEHLSPEFTKVSENFSVHMQQVYFTNICGVSVCGLAIL